VGSNSKNGVRHQRALSPRLSMMIMMTKPLVGESDCWRLGTVDPARTTPRRLLVRLRSETTASNLLSSARMPRQSSDNYVASNVYFNPDLFPAQAKLAYQLRVKRRENRARLRSGQ